MLLKEVEVGRKELIIGVPEYGKKIDLTKLTKKEVKIVRLLLNGNSRKNIMQLFGMSRNSIDQAIYRIYKKI